jgi:hypothetical protein
LLWLALWRNAAIGPAAFAATAILWCRNGGAY